MSKTKNKIQPVKCRRRSQAPNVGVDGPEAANVSLSLNDLASEDKRRTKQMGETRPSRQSRQGQGQSPKRKGNTNGQGRRC